VLIARATNTGTGLGIPETPHLCSASQFVSVYRERGNLGDRMKSSETSYYVTDFSAAEGSPEELAAHIRRHWTIENRSHYVRDRTFDEDRSPVRTGGAHQALATLRNVAISVLRRVGWRIHPVVR